MTTTHYLNNDGDADLALGDIKNPLNASVIHRPSFAHLQVELGDGEEIVADAGTLLWMDGDTGMMTMCYGGCCDAYWRTCAREACCFNKYEGPGMVALGFDLPGDMLAFGVQPGSKWLLSQGAFIAGTRNINVNSQMQSCVKCNACCSGEGLFLTAVTTFDDKPAVFYAGGYGAIQLHEVPEGKEFIVNSGLFFACDSSASFRSTFFGGCTTCCFGREGTCMVFEGPCKVYTQNRDPAVINKLLSPSLFGDLSSDNSSKDDANGGADINVD